MKHILILVAILTVHTFSVSQKLKATLGPVLTPKEIKELMVASKYKVVTHSKSFTAGLFFDTTSNKTLTFFGFSGGKFRFIVSDDYVKPGYGKDLTAEFVKDGDTESIQLLSFNNINNKVYITYTIDFPKSDQFSVYANEVSKDFVILGSPILVHKYNDLKKSGHTLSFQLSENKKQYLLFRDIETKRNELQKFECTVINEGFGEIWSKSFEMESKDKDLLIQKTAIDNNGNIFVLAEKEKKPESGPVLYFYGWKEKIFKASNLGLAEGNNFGVYLEIVKGTTPYVVGLNQQKKNVSCFIERFNVATATLENLGNNPMPEGFYKTSNFNAFETKHWSVSNLVSLENNDLVASIEARLVVSTNGIPRGYYTYYTFLNAFTEDGKLKFQHTVYKMQGSANELIGLALIPFKNKVLAIYNDHPDNLKLSPSEKKVEGYTGTKEAMTVVQQIDENGKVSKSQFTASPDFKNWNLNLLWLTKLKDNLYYTSALIRKSMFSFESRALTFEIE